MSQHPSPPPTSHVPAIAEATTAGLAHRVSGANSVWTATLALAAMNVIWGVAFPFTKPALEALSPFVFTFLRFSLATALLLPLSAGQVRAVLRGPDRNRIVLMGILGMSVAQIAQTLALDMSTASDISLLATATPVCVALLASAFLGERLGRDGAVGLGMAIVGILIVVWPQTSGEIAHLRLVGDIVFMISAFSWAAYNVLGKALAGKHPPMAITTATVLVGTVANLPFASFELFAGQSQRLTLPALGGIAFTGILVTAVGFPVLLWALRSIRATQAGMLTYLQPLAGVLGSWALLGEPLTSKFFLGGAMVLFGVGLVAGLFRRRMV